MQSLKHHFLIAMPTLGDINFSETVTYICQHDEDGALGIIVNKPGNVTIGELCARMDIGVKPGPHGERPVLAGGPVAPARGFVLHESTTDYESTIVIDEDIRLTVSRDILESMAAGAGPERALFALGYAGWGAGQLEGELAENAWLSARATSAILFDTPYEKRWAAAAELIGIDIRGISSYSGRA
jgi:putative transcriptional regulator